MFYLVLLQSVVDHYIFPGFCLNFFCLRHFFLRRGCVCESEASYKFTRLGSWALPWPEWQFKKEFIWATGRKACFQPFRPCMRTPAEALISKWVSHMALQAWDPQITLMLHFSQEREEQVLALEGFMTVTIWAGVTLRSATAMNWFEVSQSQCDIAIELNSLARSRISKTWRFGQWRGGAVSRLVNDKKSDLLSPQSFTLQPPSVCASNKKGGSNFQWEFCFADLLAFCYLIILGVMFQCMLLTSCNYSNRTFSQVGKGERISLCPFGGKLLKVFVLL